MKLRFLTTAAAVFLSASGLVRANVVPIEAATPYRLVEGSSLTAECIPCDGPPITVAIRGGFRLRLTEAGPLWTRYAVQGLSFSTSEAEPLYTASGQGDYALGEEVALLQEMRVDAAVNGQEGLIFIGETASPPAVFPWIEIDLVQTPQPDRGWFYRLHLVTTPWARLHFSTRAGFHPAAATTVFLSDGDLLSPGGWVVRKNHQLAARLGIMPGIPDLGLDAALGISRVDPQEPHQIWYSIERDIFSETLGYLHHGDLLSEEGSVVRTHLDLVRLFYPPPLLDDLGLDAVAPGPGLTMLFSVERDFLSERLGAIGRGDVLRDDGSIFRTGAQLLARFHPLNDLVGGVGLDAVHLWHHGEVWFSTEVGFEDRELGLIGHGDLLSDTGRIVARNRELLSRFAPREDLADFGLDGLWIDSSPFLEDCGVLARGVECPLFAADSGGVYMVENHGGFQEGDRVFVTGIVAPPCTSVCQEADGCIARNTIGPCTVLPCDVRPCGPLPFHRGDANDDARVDISDGIYLLAFLFTGGPPPGCADAGDGNGDDGLDIADAIYLFSYLFLGAPAPPFPGPPPLPCGQDPPGAATGCDVYRSCTAR